MHNDLSQEVSLIYYWSEQCIRKYTDRTCMIPSLDHTQVVAFFSLFFSFSDLFSSKIVLPPRVKVKNGYIFYVFSMKNIFKFMIEYE